MPTKKTEIAREIIYSELYNEMRRYRDYELSTATWYTAILIALLGFIVSAKYGNDAHLATFAQGWCVQVSTVILSTVLGLSSCYSIWYVNRRYSGIRDVVDKHLEPKWVKDAFKPMLSQEVIRPRYLIYLMLLLLVVITWIVTFSPMK